MSNHWATPIKRDPTFIARLILGLKEGEGIWFCYDNVTGHQGPHDYVTKTVSGDEYVYSCKGDHCDESELNNEDDILKLANEIVNDGHINYYSINPIEGYKKHSVNHPEDDQALGSYELNGPDRPEPQFENKKSLHMKQELLEYLVRHCVREVISQVREESEDPKQNDSSTETSDNKPDISPEPPSDNSASKMDDKTSDPSSSNEPPTEDPSGSPDQSGTGLKGIVFVDPKNKSNLEKVDFKTKNPAALERGLFNKGSKYSGSRVKISLSAIRLAKEALANPNTTVYLYIGKFDPNSEELFLMADKSLQVAKDGSVDGSVQNTSGDPTDIGNSDDTFSPMTAGADEFSQRMSGAGKTSPGDLEDSSDSKDPAELNEKLSKIIKKMVNEVLNRK